MKISKIAICAAAAAALTVVSISRADQTPVANPFLADLSTATQAELPAKAADLVAQAGAKQQSQTTIDVVKAAVGLNPAAAAIIVGSIAQTTPAMAAVAAGTAVGLVPDQATTIARVAAAAASPQAGKIVEAICRVLPADYSAVAEAVAEVVPGAGREILTGVSTAIPALQAPIAKALATSKDSVPVVSRVLVQLVPTGPLTSFEGLDSFTPANSQFLYAPPPSDPTPQIRPPYVAPPVSPINLDPSLGGVVPPGGRNYAYP